MNTRNKDKDQESNASACVAEALWRRFVDQHLRAHNARIVDEDVLLEELNLRVIILLYCSLPSIGHEMTGRKAIMRAAVTALGDPNDDRVAAMVEAAIDADMAMLSV